MSKVDVEVHMVAGITDHITQWKACYDSARIYGEKIEFVLAHTGHLQSLLNPPRLTPKSFFLAAKVGGPDPDAWASTTVHNDGSWPHWMAWMHYARARWWRRRVST